MSLLTVLLDEQRAKHVLQRVDDNRIAGHLVEIAAADARREYLVYLVVTQAHQTKTLTLGQFSYFYLLDFHCSSSNIFSPIPKLSGDVVIVGHT